jgi:CubicO group peptidase (beta-lactamase class C family)
MATLGPLLPRLRVEMVEPRRVRASLLGVEAEAVYTGNTGCVLDFGQGIEAAPDRQRALPGPAAALVEPPASLKAALDEAFTEPAEGQRKTLAIVVIHRGEIVAERYANGVSAHTPLQGWSMNKSLMASWVGMQVESGRLALDTPVREAIANLDPSLAKNVSAELNLSHLLHMESGLQFEETYFPGDDATRMLFRSPAMWRVAPGNGHRHPPGTAFNYSSGDTNLAALIWSSSLGNRPYMEWIDDAFVRPLGLAGMTSEPDASGIQVGSSYTYMPARSWARVGQFWLDAWHGRSELLSREWMRAAVTPRPSNTGGDYGRGFWLNTRGDVFPGLPTSLFYASGHNSQYVMVFPELELVVARLGLSSGRDADGFVTFLDALLASLPESAPRSVRQRLFQGHTTDTGDPHVAKR